MENKQEVCLSVLTFSKDFKTHSILS